MSVKIRLARYGAKKKPFYRIVAADTQYPRDGRFLEVVGTYNPMVDPAEVKLHEDKLRVWLGKGATPTVTVASLIKKTSFSVSPKAEAPAAEAPAE